MRALSIQLLILVRLACNDGLFLEQRRMPQRTRAREVHAAIQRTWRRGGHPARPVTQPSTPDLGARAALA
ncbi:hypothetical protein [Synechococcus sp. BS55D]|uniref:hypothetical protein n=1 Tax=Synechococcus sp. BS55D TaxID=2055943 RepID=UPI00103AAA74|nr:hypothetical protein [Synechococcus sp. BS55D]TCD57000.1 hypothetical protein CWE16_04105 [Synechococcus sp. BS55D]